MNMFESLWIDENFFHKLCGGVQVSSFNAKVKCNRQTSLCFVGFVLYHVKETLWRLSLSGYMTQIMHVRTLSIRSVEAQ